MDSKDGFVFPNDRELAVFLNKLMWSLKNQDVLWLSRMESEKVKLSKEARSEGGKVFAAFRMLHEGQAVADLLDEVRELAKHKKLEGIEEFVDRAPALMRKDFPLGSRLLRGALQLIARRQETPNINHWMHDIGIRMKEWRNVRENAKTYTEIPWFAYIGNTNAFAKAVKMMANYYHKSDSRFPKDITEISKLALLAEFYNTKWQLVIEDQSHLSEHVGWYHAIWRYPALTALLPKTNGSWKQTMLMWKQWGRRNAGRAIEWAHRHV